MSAYTPAAQDLDERGSLTGVQGPFEAEGAEGAFDVDFMPSSLNPHPCDPLDLDPVTLDLDPMTLDAVLLGSLPLDMPLWGSAASSQLLPQGTHGPHVWVSFGLWLSCPSNVLFVVWLAQTGANVYCGSLGFGSFTSLCAGQGLPCLPRLLM